MKFIARTELKIATQVALFLQDKHISNFALSGILVLSASAYPAAINKFRFVWLIAVSVLVMNLVLESGPNLHNVPDPIDAVAGMLGIAGAIGVT